MSAHRKAVPALLAIMALAAPLTDQAQAQSIWVPGSNRASVSLEVLKPIPTREHDHWTAASTAFVLSGRTPIADNLMVAAELPFAHAGVKLSRFGGEGTETHSALGNPYLGLQYRPAASAITAEAGIRIPLYKESEDPFGNLAQDVGIVADFDRLEAYLTDYLALSGRLGVEQRTETGLVLRARGGPIFWAYTGESERGESEVWLDYSAQAGYDTGPLSVMGGLTGRTLLTDDAPIRERSFHQVGMSGSVMVGGVKPGISLRVPIDDDLGEMLRYIVGVHLTVPLGFGRN